MLNQQLIDYIKQQLQRGLSEEFIVNSLIEKGWSEKEVVRCLNDEKKNIAGVSGQKQVGVLVEEKLKKILKFFKAKAVFLIFCFLLVWYIYDHFFYLDLSNNCRVVIKPSIVLEFSNKNIKQGINIIKNVLPQDYQDFCARVRYIDADSFMSGTMFGGGHYSSNKKTTIHVAANNWDASWTASVIAHEVCHAKQDFEGRITNDDSDEPECYRKTDEVLQTITVF